VFEFCEFALHCISGGGWSHVIGIINIKPSYENYALSNVCFLVRKATQTVGLLKNMLYINTEYGLNFSLMECDQLSLLYIIQAVHHMVCVYHTYPQDIKETGRGLGLTVCQKGSSITGSLIAAHIPKVNNYPCVFVHFHN